MLLESVSIPLRYSSVRVIDIKVIIMFVRLFVFVFVVFVCFASIVVCFFNRRALLPCSYHTGFKHENTLLSNCNQCLLPFDILNFNCRYDDFMLPNDNFPCIIFCETKTKAFDK